MRNHDNPGRGGWIAPTLWGTVIGTALQLQQPALWDGTAYALLVAAALAGLAAIYAMGLRAPPPGPAPRPPTPLRWRPCGPGSRRT